jgi:hypothetical protein
MGSAIGVCTYDRDIVQRTGGYLLGAFATLTPEGRVLLDTFTSTWYYFNKTTRKLLALSRSTLIGSAFSAGEVLEAGVYRWVYDG